MFNVALFLILKLEKYLPPTKENALSTRLPVGKKVSNIKIRKTTLK